jgi:hypothetical protein
LKVVLVFEDFFMALNSVKIAYKMLKPNTNKRKKAVKLNLKEKIIE